MVLESEAPSDRSTIAMLMFDPVLSRLLSRKSGEIEEELLHCPSLERCVSLLANPADTGRTELPSVSCAGPTPTGNGSVIIPETYQMELQSEPGAPMTLGNAAAAPRAADRVVPGLRPSA
jgi:hypothetical protein